MEEQNFSEERWKARCESELSPIRAETSDNNRPYWSGCYKMQPRYFFQLHNTLNANPYNMQHRNRTFSTKIMSKKKADLSQRWPRDAPYMWVPWKFSGVPDDYAHGYFSRNFNGLLFRSILWMCLQNLKIVALPVPEIIAIGLQWLEFWVGSRTPNLGEEGAVGGQRWYLSKERWWVPIGPP